MRMIGRLSSTAWMIELNVDGRVPQDDGKGDQSEPAFKPAEFDLGDWSERPPESYLNATRSPT